MRTKRRVKREDIISNNVNINSEVHKPIFFILSAEFAPLVKGNFSLKNIVYPLSLRGGLSLAAST